MIRTLVVASLLTLAIPGVSYAACTSDDVMNKSSNVAEVLSNKLSSNADEASKMMTEMGTITGGPTNDQTCAKLDDLMGRAKKL